jgi:hypothetical protein
MVPSPLNKTPRCNYIHSGTGNFQKHAWVVLEWKNISLVNRKIKEHGSRMSTVNAILLSITYLFIRDKSERFKSANCLLASYDHIWTHDAIEAQTKRPVWSHQSNNTIILVINNNNNNCARVDFFSVEKSVKPIILLVYTIRTVIPFGR